MLIGIKFPTKEIGTDRGLIREWALTAAGLGFEHIVVSDHVLGVDPAARPGFGAQFPVVADRPPYVVSDVFHEPIATISYLAALCPDTAFATGILIAPQRQTALLAKQAAQVDLLCGGRLRLCLGVGWNPVEYEALGIDFRTRGKRIEEQIAVLRALWTQETVSIEGTFDRLVGVGLAPNSIQKPIPLWMGGWDGRVLNRIGRLADGWYYGHDLPPDMIEKLGVIARAAEAARRDPADIGLEGAIEMRDGLDGLDARAERWRAVGATHLVADPALGGYRGSGHLPLLQEIARRLPLTG
jgi:probable F420-dependent oxidoreductase